MAHPPGSPLRTVHTVRTLAPADLPAAAALHTRELPDGFLAQLGPAFLRRYLATFVSTPGPIALGVHDDAGTLVGFVVGSTRNGHNRAALRLHGRTLLPAALAGLARRPRLLVPFMRTRGRRYVGAALGLARRAPCAAGPAAPGPVAPGPTGSATGLAVLLHVAVAPPARGQGTGAALVQAFADAAREAGSKRAQLVAFGEKDFYLRLGWRRVGSRPDGAGRAVVTYGRDL